MSMVLARLIAFVVPLGLDTFAVVGCSRLERPGG
jgi:hypothetical protein